MIAYPFRGHGFSESEGVTETWYSTNGILGDAFPINIAPAALCVCISDLMDGWEIAQANFYFLTIQIYNQIEVERPRGARKTVCNAFDDY